MKILTKEIVNYKEVLGSLAHMSNTDYKELFDKINQVDDMAMDFECMVQDIVAEASENREIPFTIVPEEVVDFLELNPEHRNINRILFTDDDDCDGNVRL